jgi:hypothetical protein
MAEHCQSSFANWLQRFHISGDIPHVPPRSFSCLRKRYNVTLPIWEPPGREGEDTNETALLFLPVSGSRDG